MLHSTTQRVGPCSGSRPSLPREAPWTMGAPTPLTSVSRPRSALFRPPGQPSRWLAWEGPRAGPPPRRRLTSTRVTHPRAAKGDLARTRGNRRGASARSRGAESQSARNQYRRAARCSGRRPPGGGEAAADEEIPSVLREMKAPCLSPSEAVTVPHWTVSAGDGSPPLGTSRATPGLSAPIASCACPDVRA